jgi:hypothetical protein
MDEKQAMKFLVSETKRWAHVIAKRDHIDVIFEKSLGRHGALCGHHTIWYSRTMILSNLDNKRGLTDLAIHEVIHLIIPDTCEAHGNEFQKEYEKWTGHPMTMYVSTLNHDRKIVPKPKTRGAGKTLVGKWKVEYIRYEHKNSGVYCETIKENPMTKTEATKIFKMACDKDYPAWLYQYVSSAVAHGWKKIEYHESVCGGGLYPKPKTLEDLHYQESFDRPCLPVIV